MCIAAAIIGGAVIGGGASLIAGSESAGAITSSTNASIAAQQQAQQRQQQQLAPYAGLGGGAVQQYENLLGIGGPGQPSPQQTLASTPGYQFAKGEGLTATTNAATAMGLGLSGNTLEGLDKFSTGLADTTYQQAVGNAQNAVTIGENAAAGTGAGILQTGANVGSAISGAGNTIAGIDASVAAALGKSAGNAANQYVTANTLADLQGQNYMNPSSPYNYLSGSPMGGSGFPSGIQGYDPVTDPGMVFPG